MSPVQSVPFTLQPARKRSRCRSPDKHPYELLLDLAENISSQRKARRGDNGADDDGEADTPHASDPEQSVSVGDIIAQLSEDSDEDTSDETLVVEEVGAGNSGDDRSHKLRVTRRKQQREDPLAGMMMEGRASGESGEEPEDTSSSSSSSSTEDDADDGMTIFLALPGVPQPPPICSRLLPKKRPRRFSPCSCTLVLDLDETLVAARGKDIIVRPHVVGLLQTARSLSCEIVLWTAGVHEHTQRILAAIDTVCAPNDAVVWFDHLLCRSRRWYSEERPNKDLDLLGRPLSHVLLIDNSAASAALQPSNAVLVEDYCGAKFDESLADLQSVLRAVAKGLEEQREVSDILLGSTHLMQRTLTLPHSRSKTFFLLQNGSSPTRIYGACKVEGF